MQENVISFCSNTNINYFRFGEIRESSHYKVFLGRISDKL